MPSPHSAVGRLVTMLLPVVLAACAPDALEMNPPAAGIPIALASDRARAIRNLAYDLAFDIPDRIDAPVTGRVTARFDLSDISAPLAFDFDPQFGQAQPDDGETVEEVTVNGGGSEFEHANGHVMISPAALRSGENIIEIRFRAGDASLHRNPEFLYTLFVPALAHTVFPVFDQPDLKARFTLQLTIPAGWTAVANGEESTRERAGEGERIRYARTEPIPTYLFAFAAGRFEIEEARRDGRRLRMFHRETDRPKLERNIEAVFDLHASALADLETYTGIPYAFGKFDFILIPAFEFGGMEHPGAIYYRDTGILLDESATEDQQLRRASLIAHETAHMWFGDLVTMRWFNDVWMKEVFANFMAGKLVNPSFPEVNHDLLFLTGNYPAAYSVDRTAGTHPIRQELDNLNEAGSLYGAIIYQKAPIVMRQLERILGADAFREGVRTYLEDFRFGNATWLDLVERLDDRTEVDLAAWSRAWVEQAGRPRIETELVTAPDGAIVSLALRQNDPNASPGLGWTQQIDVLMSSGGTTWTIPVEIQPGRTVVPEAESLTADFVLPNGGGLAYGDIVLDSASRDFLIGHFSELEDPLIRGSAWVTLWEEMLGQRVRPAALMDLALRALPAETTEQVSQLILDGVARLVWRFLPVSDRVAVAPVLERILRSGLDRSVSSSLKALYFRTFATVVSTEDGIAYLERVWNRREAIPGLTLSEADETMMAEQLALRSHPRASEILSEQLSRIENTDRRDRFDVVAGSLSGDRDGRMAFFESLREPANRRREPWVLDGLAYLNHPLRAGASEAMIRPGLELLTEIRDTGDIFFPGHWARTLLGGHNTPTAADAVRDFLTDVGPEYPVRLRRIVLEAADPLFRSAEILASGH